MAPPAFKTINFLGLPVTTGMGAKDVSDLIGNDDKGKFITFINPYAWHVAKQNKEYIAALSQMTYVLPDGIGISAACQKLTGLPCPRASFDMTSVAALFFPKLAEANKTVMLIGGSPGITEKVGEKLQKEYPALRVLEPKNGFETPETQVSHIMRLKPDAVVIGMGVPRQELLLARLKNTGYEGLAITCGGFFDQYLQATQYYPPLIDRLNLRFAYRIYKEPRRLWRRYFIEYQHFIFTFLRAFLKKKVSSTSK